MTQDEPRKKTGLFESIGRELFDDGGNKAAKKPTKGRGGAGSMLGGASAPPPTATFSTPQLDIPLASSPSVGAQGSSDNTALEQMSQQVLVDKIDGRPSNYMLFVRMWEALGKPTAVEQVLNALKVSNPNLTKDEVLLDLRSHASRLEEVRANMTGQVDAFAQQAQSSTESQIAELRKKNEDATSEITRHQNEIGERNTKIGTLQSEKSESETKVGRARSRITSAVGTLTGQFQQIETLLVR